MRDRDFQQLVQLDTAIEAERGFECRWPGGGIKVVAHCMHNDLAHSTWRQHPPHLSLVRGLQLGLQELA